jgi:NAD(P)-dependent dehydrogenase (short-subunit alcohol dehydrogenase family)
MPLDEFRQVVEVNLLGTINTMRLAVEQMAATPRTTTDDEAGVIVNTASIAAFDGQIGQAAYAASKAGVAALTLPMARELGDLGIRVMCVAPGVFATPMTLDLPQKSRDVVFAAKPPFPQRPGRPEEFASVVRSIIEAPMLNGEVIRLDGGLRMPARL